MPYPPAPLRFAVPCKRFTAQNHERQRVALGKHGADFNRTHFRPPTRTNRSQLPPTRTEPISPRRTHFGGPGHARGASPFQSPALLANPRLPGGPRLLTVQSIVVREQLLMEPSRKSGSRTAKILFAGYVALFVWAAVNPYDRATWWAENIPIVLIVVSLAVLYIRGFVFSSTAYVLMSVLLYMHTIGGHYTFERVPFDFVTNLFGFQRNHYDRVAHFSVGFYAFAIAEALVRTKAVRSRLVLWLFPVFSIACVAMGYELIEWWYAAAEGGASGAAFLGSQGDVWDAQKDMLADTLGAILATTCFFLVRKPAISTGL